MEKTLTPDFSLNIRQKIQRISWSGPRGQYLEILVLQDGHTFKTQINATNLKMKVLHLLPLGTAVRVMGSAFTWFPSTMKKPTILSIALLGRRVFGWGLQGSVPIPMFSNGWMVQEQLQAIITGKIRWWMKACSQAVFSSRHSPSLLKWTIWIIYLQYSFDFYCRCLVRR